MVLVYALLSGIIISLISFIGVFFLAIKKKKLENILLLLVGFSVGGLLGGAFLHLLPESLENGSNVWLYVIIGFVVFFILEKVLHWHHCHKGKCDVHMFTYMNLVGDGVHNFIDGLIISGSFLIDFRVGLVTSLAIIIHEIPQEIGDFGVLVYGGFSKAKALFCNFFVALISLVGVIVGYFIGSFFEVFNQFLLAFAAGGFIYIAATDLVPELHKETEVSRSISSLVMFLLGIVLMYSLKFIL